MAVCNQCKQEMLTSDGCVPEPVEFPDGRKLAPIAYSGEERCHDCMALPGRVHHPGCDMERCPLCEGQLISCGCLADPADDEDD